MNGELLPAVMATTGGSGLLGTILYLEHRRAEAMRASRQRFGLRFPIGLNEASAIGVMSTMAGLPGASEFVVEVAATMDGITHSLLVPGTDVDAVRAALASATKPLELAQTEAPRGLATRSLRLFVPRMTVLRRDEIEAGSRALLAGLAAMGPREEVVIRWALAAGRAPMRAESRERTREGRDADRVWRQKAAGSGFFARGLVLVRAESGDRARVLSEMVNAIYRSRRGAVGNLRTTVDRRGTTLGALPRIGRSDGWLGVPEVLGLIGWPLGDVAPAGVELGASRVLRVRRDVGRHGRRLFVGQDGRGERVVALSPEAAKHHLAVVGPSGTGKSVVLARGILDDLRAGHPGAVVDPKADLVADVLARVPRADADRVVVLDAAAGGRVPGLALLSAGDPELRSDVIVGALRGIFASSWGIRSDLYLRLAVRSLAEIPEARLTDMGRLFFDARFRAQAIRRLSDPLLRAAWQQYESLSAAEQIQHVQSPMAKVMALLSRPSVRAVLAAPNPQLDISRLFAEGRWLLVPVSPGLLGEPASRLIAASVMYCIWAAIEARAALPAKQRPYTSIVVDELATVTSGVPFGFEPLAERARGLGAGLTVAVQSVARLPESVRSALLTNTASLISFRASADDAQRLAREFPGLTAADLQQLGRFRLAARIGVGAGSAISVMTGWTQPLPETTGQAARIRKLSAERYGSEPEPNTVEADAEPTSDAEMGNLGRSRRES